MLDKSGHLCYTTIRKRKEKEIKKMKMIGKYAVIYRVVGESGMFVSTWVFEKRQANKIMEDVKKNLIFGWDEYHIEESTIAL